MMVGHAALAFALAAWAAAVFGVSRERALLFGAAAGAFAITPDVDMGYALVGLSTVLSDGPAAFPEAFWETGNTVHRGVTHSLLVGGVAAALFGLAAHRRFRAVGLAGLGALAAATLALAGPLEAAVVTLFALAGVAVVLGARWAGLGSRAALAAALVGVLSHPFGDIFTGTAPHLLYPLDVRLLPERVLLASDPTLHMLGTFGLELAAMWLAVAVAMRLRGRSPRQFVHRRAVLGAGYVGTVLALPPPTLSVSYHFVFSVLAVGLVGAVDLPAPNLRSPRARRTAAVTGLAAVTIAWLAYTVGYVAVG